MHLFSVIYNQSKRLQSLHIFLHMTLIRIHSKFVRIEKEVIYFKNSKTLIRQVEVH